VAFFCFIQAHLLKQPILYPGSKAGIQAIGHAEKPGIFDYFPLLSALSETGKYYFSAAPRS
jgi:hypothetical protein